MSHVVELPPREAAFGELPPGVALAPAVRVREGASRLLPRSLYPRGCLSPSPPPSSTARQESLERYGVRRLFTHQVAAVAAAAAGRHVVVSTATASGKSVCYNGPVLSGLAANPQVQRPHPRFFVVS